MNKTKLKKFYELFSSDDQILIPIFADPDAIGSAMAMKRLLWRKISSITIATINTVKRPDNLALISLLGVKLTPIKDIQPEQFSKVIYIDSQPSHNPAFEKFEPDIIIDHHPEGDLQATYKDIRPRYGATATIMLEYLKAANIKPSEKLATALYWAIKTDTDSFNRKAIYEDVRAFQYLFQFANIQWIRKIESAEIRPAFLKHFKTAIECRKKRKDWLFSHLGTVSTPDVCVIIADFFLKIEDINWSIISGIYGNKLIIIFRSFGYRRNAGAVAERGFSEIGSAGGHKTMARAEIPLANIKEKIDCQNPNRISNWIINQIKKKS